MLNSVWDTTFEKDCIFSPQVKLLRVWNIFIVKNRFNDIFLTGPLEKNYYTKGIALEVICSGNTLEAISQFSHDGRSQIFQKI